MLPLHYWNSLTERTRVTIADTILGCSILDTEAYRHLAQPFYHRLTSNKLLKDMLQHLRLQKDGTIDIVITITPNYAEQPKKYRPRYIPHRASESAVT